MTSRRISDTRLQLIRQQNGRCARCHLPLHDSVHISRIRDDSDDSRVSKLVAIHVACSTTPVEIAVPAQHANGATPITSHRCPRCGTPAGQPCVTSSGAITKPHKARQTQT